ncbi:hypothetical protein HIM_06432 [Hirsutella minnesotensis 3608]|uniref:GDP/GTP exchange factor Sec2 N-terminal domain-containing protein n=1 Tax=Hirsutella minnesotensis 3608 TaxID=1043627 RepID=A0A0F7ZJ74_9HYPO|nr:hypothetical protein HIM_06432 [Hirsutella minnesotensis 3608]
MSSTAVITMATAVPPPSTISTKTTTAACCPGCGYGLPPIDQTQTELISAQSRVRQLEAHVRQLNHKAAAAVDRWATYEAEMSKLRAQLAASNRASSSLSNHQLDPASATTPSPTRTSFLQSAPSRLSSFLYPRKSTPNLRADSSPPSAHMRAKSIGVGSGAPASNTTEGLLEALTREQTLRREAEGRLSATSKEVEELSASLFEQANEMVADERRARARLEQRVGELEKRDAEKRKRLERLEVAMQRIEKVKSLLNDT